MASQEVECLNQNKLQNRRQLACDILMLLLVVYKRMSINKITRNPDTRSTPSLLPLTDCLHILCQPPPHRNSFSFQFGSQFGSLCCVTANIQSLTLALFPMVCVSSLDSIMPSPTKMLWYAALCCYMRSLLLDFKIHVSNCDSSVQLRFGYSGGKWKLVSFL